MKSKKYDQGSATLWVVIVLVIILAAGGYMYFKNSQRSSQNISSQTDDLNSIPAVQSTGDNTSVTVQAQDSSINSQSNTMNAAPNNVSSLTCNQIFPSDVVQKMFPSPTASVKGLYTKGVGLNCEYLLDDPKTFTAGVTASVIIPDLGVESYDTVLGNLTNGLKGLTSSYKCTPTNNVGTKSSECIYAQKSIIETINSSEVVFSSSNNKYLVAVVLSQQVPLTASDQEGIILQMAKEVDSKLSSN